MEKQFKVTGIRIYRNRIDPVETEEIEKSLNKLGGMHEIQLERSEVAAKFRVTFWLVNPLIVSQETLLLWIHICSECVAQDGVLVVEELVPPEKYEDCGWLIPQLKRGM